MNMDMCSILKDSLPSIFGACRLHLMPFNAVLLSINTRYVSIHIFIILGGFRIKLRTAVRRLDYATHCVTRNKQ